jgi:hypothetical protein
MNIKKLDQIATALFPQHYTPQFDIVFPEAERTKIEKCSDRDRELYALMARYSPDKAKLAYEAALKQCGDACDGNSVMAREKLISKSEIEEKYADLSAHYMAECHKHWRRSGYAIIEQLTARVSDAVRAFENAVRAWEAEASAAAGVKIPISLGFADMIADIRHPLMANLERVRDSNQSTYGNTGLSVGDFVSIFIGHEFRPLSEFIAQAEKL